MEAGDECTNYAAYVESSVYGVPTPGYRLGNGGEWAGTAAAHGVEVNGTPTVGSVAEWNAGDYGMGEYGHVAIVESVGPGDSYIDVSQQNIFTDANGYDWEQIPAGQSSGAWEPWPNHFIHFNGAGGGALAEGSFVSYQGMVYRIAGGAPLYVSNWNNVGGQQPTQALTSAQWAALPAVPRNGTLIGDSANGMVYEIAGGAPLYVSNWAAIGGSRATVTVDHWDIANIGNPAAHLNAVPANGTVLGASGGGVFVVAGGAPLYVSNWNAIGGSQPYVAVDQWDIDNISNPAAHLNAVPSNGTFVNARTSSGQEAGSYVIAGGAPFYISTWSVFGGEPAGLVSIDAWDISNTVNPAAHLRGAPVDGTVVEGRTSDSYWSFKGGVRRHTAARPGPPRLTMRVLRRSRGPLPWRAPAPRRLSHLLPRCSPVRPIPDGEPVSECRFEYGTTTAYGSSVPCRPSLGEGEAATPVSATAAGLVANTVYHYRLLAVGPGGRGVGSDQTFRTTPAPAVAVLGAKDEQKHSGPDAHLTGTALSASGSGTVDARIDCPSVATRCTGNVTLRTVSGAPGAKWR